MAVARTGQHRRFVRLAAGDQLRQIESVAKVFVLEQAGQPRTIEAPFEDAVPAAANVAARAGA